MSGEERAVHKFGGTRVASAERYRAVAEIVKARPEPRRGVVVSALSGVADALVRTAEKAGSRDPAYRGELAELRARHRAAIEDLLPGAAGVGGAR